MVVIGNLVNYYRSRCYLRLVQDHEMKLAVMKYYFLPEAINPFWTIKELLYCLS